MASDAGGVAPLRLRIARRPEHDVRRRIAWREDLRSVGELVGIALAVAGAAGVAASALVNLTLALPLHQVVQRPPLWLGLATALTGATAARTCRTRRARRRPRAAGTHEARVATSAGDWRSHDRPARERADTVDGV